MLSSLFRGAHHCSGMSKWNTAAPVMMSPARTIVARQQTREDEEQYERAD